MFHHILGIRTEWENMQLSDTQILKKLDNKTQEWQELCVVFLAIRRAPGTSPSQWIV